MGLRVNLGAGDDIRDGWLNIDDRDDYGRTYDGVWQYAGIEGPWRADMRYLDDATKGASLANESADLVLLNHSLHAVSYDDAELVLDHAVRILAGGGRLVIVEADILGVLAEMSTRDRRQGERARFVADLISDEIEPTLEGKYLRWAAWYGERRSLWSAESLTFRLSDRGLLVEYAGPSTLDPERWAGNRALESFTVVGVSLQ